jgi:membrane-associated phospholipid phosphatase
LLAAVEFVLAVLDHAGALRKFNAETLRLIDVVRPSGLVPVLNWAFRLAYPQVDLGVAVVWSVVLVLRGSSLSRAIVPLVLVPLIGLEVGIRLVVNAPAPDRTYALERPTETRAATGLLDRGDLVARTAFQVATGPSATNLPPPSFPSGHAMRALFLAFLVGSTSRERSASPRSLSRTWRAILLAAGFSWAGLVGYSALYFGYHWPIDVLAGYILGISGWLVSQSCLLDQAVSRIGARLTPRATTGTA